MDENTTFFTLCDNLNKEGVTVAKADITSGKETWEMTDEELLQALNKILSGVNTLDDYKILVTVVSDLADCITMRFLYVFFQALVPVEERIWGNAGMHPPIAKIMDENIDLLLSEYTEFAYNLEAALVGWTKKNGYFSNPEKHAFIARRNEIYGEYITFAGKVINAVY